MYMIENLYSTIRDQKPKRINTPKKGCWIHLTDPSPEELEKLAQDHGLEHDLLTDSTDIYEIPRIEREGKDVYVFARYSYPRERDVSTEPLLIIFTGEVIITIQRIESDILKRLTSGIEPVATTQKTKVFLQILSAVNYSYEKSIYEVNKQVLSIRRKLKNSELELKNSFIVDFIDTEETLNEYLIALQPQALMLRNLLNGRFLPLYDQDKDLIEDLTLGSSEIIDLIKSRLKTISNIRDAYSTMMANNLNRIFKRLTSIGIFLAVPTIMSSLYGMNVILPNAASPYAFWEILIITGLLTGSFVYVFKKLKWL